MLPDIMSWPRGSNMRPVRIQSNSFRKCWRRSLMLAPCSCGPPPETTRTGLPQVWASMQEKVCLDMARYSAAFLQLVADLGQQRLGRGRPGRSGGLFLPLKAVDLFHHHEQGEGDDQEVDDRVDEGAIGDDGMLRLFRLRERECGGRLR